MDDNDVDMTAFVTHSGLFHYIRMPCGLKDIPATFQSAKSFISASVTWQIAIVYIDDIIIFFRSSQQHLLPTGEIKRLLKNASITPGMDKWHSFCESNAYPRHVIASGKLQAARKITEAFSAP